MRKALSIILCFALLFCITPAASAAENTNTTSSKSNAILSIADPTTGNTWEWEIPIQSAKINESNQSRNISPEQVCNIETNIDISDYLLETFTYEELDSVYNVLYDDITLTIGIYYKYSAEYNTISLRNVYGSTPRSGDYYASNRQVYYTNQYAGIQDYYYPTTDSWQIATQQTSARYNSEVPPFAQLSCEIHITDMSAYRTVTVTCSVNE